jgi:hypothetical protein
LEDMSAIRGTSTSGGDWNSTPAGMQGKARQREQDGNLMSGRHGNFELAQVHQKLGLRYITCAQLLK